MSMKRIKYNNPNNLDDSAYLDLDTIEYAPF